MQRDTAPLLRFAPFTHTTHVFSVGELEEHIASVIESDAVLQEVWLRGEVTNLSRSPAGHAYFVLKDQTGQLRCVLFRGNAFNSPVAPANGLALIAHGSIRFYERHGTCELVADLLFPEGVGLAHMQFELLYRRLEQEGLFDPSRKRPLPKLPRRIGIVSSEKGAVIHDLLSVLARRYPLGEVVFIPAPVQGVGAAAALAQALNRLGHWRPSRDGRGVDLVVLARGGGSDEDLAAFNDERLARAIFASPVPVVSAVGHETNLTLSDLVADVRAPTPSAAAELLAPDVHALRRELDEVHHRVLSNMAVRLAQARMDCDLAAGQLASGLSRRIRLARDQLDARQAQLRALSPRATLARGYAVAEIEGHALRDAREASPGQPLLVHLHRGELQSTVTAVAPEHVP
jgi:exodeoxyribonuclease VII large subunit